MADRAEHGSSTIELALACPLLALFGALGVQAALWAHAQNVAHAAAQQGARATASADGTPYAGQRRAREYLTILGPQMLRDISIVSHSTETVAEVRVQGTVVSIVPGLTLRVSEGASHRREQFLPDVP